MQGKGLGRSLAFFYFSDVEESRGKTRRQGDRKTRRLADKETRRQEEWRRESRVERITNVPAVNGWASFATERRYATSNDPTSCESLPLLCRMARKSRGVSKQEQMVDFSLRLCWHINEKGGFKEYLSAKSRAGQKRFFSIFR